MFTSDWLISPQASLWKCKLHPLKNNVNLSKVCKEFLTNEAWWWILSRDVIMHKAYYHSRLARVSSPKGRTFLIYYEPLSLLLVGILTTWKTLSSLLINRTSKRLFPFTLKCKEVSRHFQIYPHWTLTGERFRKVPFSKCSPSTLKRKAKRRKQNCIFSRRFQIYPFWKVFLKSSVFGGQFIRIIVDSRRKTVRIKLRFEIYPAKCGRGLNIVIS